MKKNENVQKEIEAKKPPKNVTFSEKVPKLYNISLFKILSKLIFHKNIVQLEAPLRIFFSKKIIIYKKR